MSRVIRPFFRNKELLKIYQKRLDEKVHVNLVGFLSKPLCGCNVNCNQEEYEKKGGKYIRNDMLFTVPFLYASYFYEYDFVLSCGGAMIFVVYRSMWYNKNFGQCCEQKLEEYKKIIFTENNNDDKLLKKLQN